MTDYCITLPKITRRGRERLGQARMEASADRFTTTSWPRASLGDPQLPQGKRCGLARARVQKPESSTCGHPVVTKNSKGQSGPGLERRPSIDVMALDTERSFLSLRATSPRMPGRSRAEVRKSGSGCGMTSWSAEFPFPRTTERSTHGVHRRGRIFYLACGSPTPTRVLDLFIKYRNLTNLALPEKTWGVNLLGLLDALRVFDIHGYQPVRRRTCTI